MPAGWTTFCACSALTRRTGRCPGSRLLHRELDEDLFILGAEQFDLRDVGNQKKPRTNGLDTIAELAMGKAVACEAVDDAERVAEVVVQSRSDNSGRQGVADVTDALANAYQVSVTSLAVALPCRFTKIVVTPAFV